MNMNAQEKEQLQENLRCILDGQPTELVDKVCQAVVDIDKHEADPKEDRYRELAKEQYANDECEIDDNALVSVGDGGAFVQAWVYVEDEA